MAVWAAPRRRAAVCAPGAHARLCCAYRSPGLVVGGLESGMPRRFAHSLVGFPAVLPLGLYIYILTRKAIPVFAASELKPNIMSLLCLASAAYATQLHALAA